MRALASIFAATAYLSLSAIPATAQDGARDGEGTWITLGTGAGPVTSSTRSQPANLLRFGGHDYLVDVGDGTAGQSGKAGVQTKAIDAIFISHLHFDHTAGLTGILGLRFQTSAGDPLTIYGPPETQQLVDGILAGMEPGATANYGVAGAAPVDHRSGIRVVEMRDGDSVDVDGMTVTVRENSHYSFPVGSELAARFESLSYRFDLPGRSIVYTGDTGPSDAVEELASGADLLVVEMMDIPLTIERMIAANPGIPEAVSQAMQSHLSEHHLSPTQVGELATRAGVGSVVVTHFSGWEKNQPGHMRYLQEIAAAYDGPFLIADDMDSF
ncbi:MBL fold metallo-hydrolase [Aurantiacibacter odishensis]|uniref:MBL fold metallo-hydrolase n=1 Tax=Aurantiacibacter odishensis TaxID=1155476 RepID=UPI000E743AA3|nr:MBL fold metallo-hydrolase [Aurantiacibacter odishensis]